MTPADRNSVRNASGVHAGVEPSRSHGPIFVFAAISTNVTKIAAAQAVIEGKYLTNQVLTINLQCFRQPFYCGAK